MERVVLITGASSGIGREVSKLFLLKNYNLILSGRNKEGFEYVRGYKNVDIVLGDISKKETRKRMIDLIRNKYKSIDILINNAGITYIQPFEENTEDQLNNILDVNLKAPILLTHDLYPIFKEQKSGSIMFINSAAGKQGYANHTLYSTSKFALNGFSQSLKLEAKKYGIRVISIHPGGVKTSLYDMLKTKPDVDQYMDPIKLAEIIVYLAETDSLSPDDISISRTTK